MSEVNKEKFGAFVAARRRELGLTQKELAERLFVSDKAVSKWERGLSLPDVALLEPLSGALGVGLTELLRGERLAQELEPGEVEELMSGALRLSTEEKALRDRGRRRWRMAYALCAALGLAGSALLLALGHPLEGLKDSVLLVEVMCLAFGAYLCFFAKETLPGYYDKNRISLYGDGVFRMNLPGLRLNNSNWPHVVNAMRGWLLGTAAVFPAVWLAGTALLSHEVWTRVGYVLTLAAALGFLFPAYVVGKKYE